MSEIADLYIAFLMVFVTSFSIGFYEGRRAERKAKEQA